MPNVFYTSLVISGDYIHTSKIIKVVFICGDYLAEQNV